ncbi:MAG: hypothetical protein JNM92_14210 [Zoogloea sp.]|nr:hypothetical protein [Zoogloea sp.]
MNPTVRVLSFVLLSQLSSVVPASGFIAGLKPDQRPAEAPRVTAVVIDQALKEQRLKGISQPWPGNLETIATQGNWYSPLFLPGMPGRYDLRGLHAR